jgi:hypothetical protein
MNQSDKHNPNTVDAVDNGNKELLQSCCFESGESSIDPGFVSVFKSKSCG